MAAAGLFADSRESVLAESGDYLLALAEGAVGPGHIRAEIGEILLGRAPGRADDQEITVFESLGIAVEDLAAAALAYRNAAESAPEPGSSSEAAGIRPPVPEPRPGWLRRTAAPRGTGALP